MQRTAAFLPADVPVLPARAAEIEEGLPVGIGGALWQKWQLNSAGAGCRHRPKPAASVAMRRLWRKLAVAGIFRGQATFGGGGNAGDAIPTRDGRKV